MRYLIDTQAVIWMLDSDPKLSNKASLAIKNIQNELYVSIASLWEMTIKRSLGKLISVDGEFKKYPVKVFW